MPLAATTPCHVLLLFHIPAVICFAMPPLLMLSLISLIFAADCRHADYFRHFRFRYYYFFIIVFMLLPYMPPCRRHAAAFAITLIFRHIAFSPFAAITFPDAFRYRHATLFVSLTLMPLMLTPLRFHCFSFSLLIFTFSMPCYALLIITLFFDATSLFTLLSLPITTLCFSFADLRAISLIFLSPDFRFSCFSLSPSFLFSLIFSSFFRFHFLLLSVY